MTDMPPPLTFSTSTNFGRTEATLTCDQGGWVLGYTHGDSGFWTTISKQFEPNLDALYLTLYIYMNNDGLFIRINGKNGFKLKYTSSGEEVDV
jgi:hypothetical protein